MFIRFEIKEMIGDGTTYRASHSKYSGYANSIIGAVKACVDRIHSQEIKDEVEIVYKHLTN